MWRLQVSPGQLAEKLLPYTRSRSPKLRGAALVTLLASMQRMQAADLSSAGQSFLQAAGQTHLQGWFVSCLQALAAQSHSEVAFTCT